MLKEFGRKVRKDWLRNRSLYLLMLPVIIFYVLFHYKPMYGALIAFKDYSPALGFADSPWVGLDNFVRFFDGIYFWRLLRNTVLLSFYNILFGFPAPIILALLLNEVKNEKFKRLTQTITYLPHFISMIVVAGMITNFCMTTGLFNDIIEFFGGEASPLLQNPKYYRTIYVASSIWQQVGWGSIIYLSALSGVSPEYYEAATIDGAGRLKCVWHITLPCIKGTIGIMFIFAVGGLLSAGFDQILLLQQPANTQISEILDTYILKRGLQYGEFEYATAIGLFKSAFNLFMMMMANFICKKTMEVGVW